MCYFLLSYDGQRKRVFTILFNYTRYGQETLKTVRDYEKDLSRFNKASLDIGFLQNASCSIFTLNFPHPSGQAEDKLLKKLAEHRAA